MVSRGFVNWLRWSNVLQFLRLPTFGHEMPLRMAEVWTRRSLDVFAQSHLPLAAPAVAIASVGGRELTPEWVEVRDYTDPVLSHLIAIMADANVAVPEAGAQVGPTETVGQVEMAWPDVKVAVVVYMKPQRDSWLRAAGWAVASITADSIVEDGARDIAGAVKGGSR